MTGHHPFNSSGQPAPENITDRQPPAPEVPERNWTCPGCDTNYDGKPEVVTTDPLECFCSQSCFKEHTGRNSRSVGTDHQWGGR